MPDMLDQAVQDYITSAKSQTAAGFATTPQDAARSVQLEDVTGTPAPLIRPDVKAYDQSTQRDMASVMVERDPQLMAYVHSHPMAAAVSQNDWGNLSMLSQAAGSHAGILKTLNAPWDRGFDAALEAMKDDFNAPVRSYSPQDVLNKYPNLQKGGPLGTLAATTTIATGINKARAEIVWQEKSLFPEAELAANHAAVITLFETKPNPRTNFCNFGQDAVTNDFWVVPAPRLKTAWPSRTSIKSALNNGHSPIGVQTNGASYLVNRITTRSLNGSTNDYRIRAAHKVTICDFFGDDLLAKTVLQFGGKRIAADPAQGQRPPGADVLTPIVYRGAILGLLDVYDTNDLLDNVAAIKSGLVVQRETSPTTRMSARIPLRPIDNCEQFAIALDQVA